MAYKFTETFDFILPDVQEQLSTFSESEFNKNHGLVIEVAAIHRGATANYNHYSEEALTKAVNSWLEPYPKPIIMNHNPHSEAVGRVMGARMDKEVDGTPFIRLQAAILDPEAIRKVADGRYLTGSVGGKAEEAICTICSTNWAAPKDGAGLPCRHQRGKVYSGKIAQLDMREIAFKEYSFVNMPADETSGVRKIGVTEAEDTNEWIKPARFFVLDMVSEGIVEYTESAASRDVLVDMRKKDALPLYMGLKGAFISAQVVHEEDLSIKDSVKLDKLDTTNDNDPNFIEEKAMSKENSDSDTEEDILAVAEELSADLAAPIKDEEVIEASEGDEPEEEVVEDSLDSENTEESNEEKEESEELEEGERPEGQEKPQNKDVDPENSDGAPKSREDDSEGKEEVAEEEPVEAELDASQEDIEPQENKLTQRVAELEEENARLRKALHGNLVERVVDTKIALGILTLEDRADEIAEHATRSAGSLADSLRDFAKMEPKTVSSSNPTELEMQQTLQNVGIENNVSTMKEDEEPEIAETAEKKFEDLMVDVFLGKRSA